jgi:hypothetical protein
VAKLSFGPARVLSRESPVEAIELLRERGYTANEIDFESGFWIDYPSAEELGKLARKRRIALSVRNETKHLPYGEGTLRVAPLGKALARFPRPATVISHFRRPHKAAIPQGCLSVRECPDPRRRCLNRPLGL